MTAKRLLLGSALGTTLFVVAAGALAASHPSNGTGPRIVSVRAVPVTLQRETGPLSRTSLNTVTASTALGFRVEVRNEGTTPAANVTVTVTIARKHLGGPISHAKTLATIAPRQTRTVTFSNLGPVPFASQTQLKVNVRAGATKTYPVIFSLPAGNGAAPVRATGRLAAVPNVVGLPEQDAIDRLQSLGFQILVVALASHAPNPRVIAETPGSGARISTGSIVRIEVARQR